jgi:hypothetical protein
MAATVRPRAGTQPNPGRPVSHRRRAYRAERCYDPELADAVEFVTGAFPGADLLALRKKQ